MSIIHPNDIFSFHHIIFHRGSFYAEPIKRIRDAGAIPIAVTNVPELCMWMETSNRYKYIQNLLIV